MAYLKVAGRVDVPVDRAAKMAKDPELLSHWLDGVVVADLGDDRTRWAVDDTEFDVLRMPTGDKHLIRWRALSGRRHTGVVRFKARGASTDVVIEVAWDGGQARALRRRLKDALRDFTFEAVRLPELSLQQTS
jgi:hypothetical protein